MELALTPAEERPCAADEAESADALERALVAALAANDDGRYELDEDGQDEVALLARDEAFASVCDARRDAWLARVMEEDE